MGGDSGGGREGGCGGGGSDGESWLRKLGGFAVDVQRFPSCLFSPFTSSSSSCSFLLFHLPLFIPPPSILHPSFPHKLFVYRS